MSQTEHHKLKTRLALCREELASARRAAARIERIKAALLKEILRIRREMTELGIEE